MTKLPNWLRPSTTYTAAMTGARFSPSRSAGDFLRNGIEAIDPNGAAESTRNDFARAVMQTAAATVASWTGKPVNVTNQRLSHDAATLIVSAEAIVKRGNDPAAATDYATGRLLTNASQARYLTTAERQALAQRAERYGQSSLYTADPKTVAREYAAAMLAASVAAIRGREAVLHDWPGWGGYFRASDADYATPEQAAAFVTDGKAAPIVRAAFALSRIIEGRPVPVPAELAAMVAKGMVHMEAQWNKGKHLERADRAILDMIEADEQGSDHATTGPTIDGDGQPSEEKAPGTELENQRAENGRGSLPIDTKAEPQKGGNPVMPTPEPGLAHYRVTERPVGTNHYTLSRMREAAAPMIAALRRIAWECELPPQYDRAQERGDIDEGALARLAADNDPRVFQTRQEQGSATVAVTVLVDCSGSMGTFTNSGRSRIEEARAVAFAIATAFGSNPRYSVSVAGHDCRYRFCGEGVQYYTCAKPQDISGLGEGGDNADGYAIAHAIQRTAAARADRRIVILVADGCPNARGYKRGSASRHIRAVVENGARRGIGFLAVGIEGGIDNEEGAQMFGPRRFVAIGRTAQAGPLLARVIGSIAKAAPSA